MKDRVIEIRSSAEAKKLLAEIGAYKASFNIMAPKAILRILYLKDIPFAICNVLKQEMLSVGGEAAVSKGVVSARDKKSDCLIIGNLPQIKNLILKLKKQPPAFSGISYRIERLLGNYQKKFLEFRCRNFKLNLNQKTYIMAVLNVTPDSFSDGGQFFDEEKAFERALQLEKEGADIIDIGGQSTRPGAKEINFKEEIRRVLPIIKRLRRRIKIPISIDTYKFGVAKAALEEGASILNDIYGLRRDRRLAKLAAKFKAGVVLMHIKGTPRFMQRKPYYKDLMGDIIDSLSQSIDLALNAGISEKNIVVDPGLGFGKTVKHNLSVIKNLSQLRSLGCPVLIGPSRKSFIGKTLHLPIGERLYGTIASVCACVLRGADIVRVHDVAYTKQAIKIIDEILRSPNCSK